MRLNHGKADLLVIGDYIQKVGAVNRDALLKLELDTQFVDASDCFVVPGLIDPHERARAAVVERR